MFSDSSPRVLASQPRFLFPIEPDNRESSLVSIGSNRTLPGLGLIDYRRTLGFFRWKYRRVNGLESVASTG